MSNTVSPNSGYNASRHEYNHGLTRLTLRDIYDHLTGPLISLVFHIMVIGVICTLIISPAPKKSKEIVTTVKMLKPVEIEKMPELPKPEEVTEETDSVSDNSFEDMIPNDNNNQEEPEKLQEELSNMPISQLAPEVEFVLTSNNSSLRLEVPHTMMLRKNIAGAIQKHGGRYGRKAELAVRKALKWLTKHQNSDGSWGQNRAIRPAFTALAVLAFLGHNEGPLSERYGSTVVRGIRKLLDISEKTIISRRRYVAGPTYTHPIVVYALAEIYTITRAPGVRRILEQLAEPLIENINLDGYYTYGYDDHIYQRYRSTYRRAPVTGRFPTRRPDTIEYVRSDLTFSAWNYQALKALYLSKVRKAEVFATIKKAVKGLKKADIGKEKSDYTMTCLGALCLGILGEEKSATAQRCYKFIRSFDKRMLKTCNWKGDPELIHRYPNSFSWAIYTWYYQTMTLFQLTKGGRNPIWRGWERSFAKAYTREQERDGSFSSPAQKYGKLLDPGSSAEWTKVRDFSKPLDHAIYCTTFACLTLEVYYRYLPTYAALEPPRNSDLTASSLQDPDFESLSQQ